MDFKRGRRGMGSDGLQEGYAGHGGEQTSGGIDLEPLTSMDFLWPNK